MSETSWIANGSTISPFQGFASAELTSADPTVNAPVADASFDGGTCGATTSCPSTMRRISWFTASQMPVTIVQVPIGDTLPRVTQSVDEPV